MTVGSAEVCGRQGPQVSTLGCTQRVACSPWAINGATADPPLGTWHVQTAASQQNFTWSPNGALVAHTLVYRSTAGILGSSIASAVMIVSGPAPAFSCSLMWLGCRKRFTVHSPPAHGLARWLIQAVTAYHGSILQVHAGHNALHLQVDVTTGRRVRVDLEVPYPPFYFHWSPCGTRLAMLSNWHHMQCAHCNA